MKFFDRLKPVFWDHPVEPGEEHVSFRRMWQINLAAAVTASLLPLLLIAGIGLHHMNSLVTLEETQQEHRAGQLISCSRLRLALFLRERISALKLAAQSAEGQNRCSSTMKKKLEHLNKSFGGFEGLASLNDDGSVAQGAAWGQVPPPDLLRTLNEDARGKGQAISGVFQGSDKRKYFAAAVRMKSGKEKWVCCAVLPAGELSQAAAGAVTNPGGSAYVIDAKGDILAWAGQKPATTRVKPPPAEGNFHIWWKKESENKESLLCLGRVADSPFFLLNISPMATMPHDWAGSRRNLIILAVISTLFILAVAYKGTRWQVTRIYQAHLEQSQLVREVSYTHKLASVGRLAAGVAHQINNPMAVINEKAGLMSDLLEMGPNRPGKERLSELTNHIQQEVQRVGAITHHLLSFARHLPVELKPVRLDLIIREAAGFLESDASQRDISLVMDLPPGGKTIKSDKSLLEQVMLNVINNAVAAVDQGGRVEISLNNDPDGGAIVEVSDNGRGIPAEHLGHIFEPYFTTKGELGSGLGLSVTHGIIQKLGGSIGVQSVEGQGAVFTINLPTCGPEGEDCHDDEAMAALLRGEDPNAPKDEDQETGESPIRILVVDDEVEYLEIVSERLSMRGFEVHSCRDGHQALGKIARGGYHSVILDMMMPGLGGMEALRQIKRDHPGIQVILQTGHATPDRQALAAELGAAALLEKPVDLDLLSEKILEGAEPQENANS